MAGLVHVAAGFAAKPLVPRAPVWLTIVAAVLLDLLAAAFALLGLEKMGHAPWTHGLLMAVAWSITAGLIFGLLYRERRMGLLLGALVFSHWLVDYITHPMGAVFGERFATPDLPLLFDGSPKVGLGLYNSSAVTAYVTELASLALGIALYGAYKLRQRAAKLSSGGPGGLAP